MKKQTIFSLSSPYRDDFRIKAYTFGEGKKTLCVVGAMRGDEMQQLYLASQLVAWLKQVEEEGRIMPGISISVIPCANPSSINIEKRFWALDGTDINRMFPGYDQGETTQRIAAGVFEFIKDFQYGIQLASYYLTGQFLPHVRMFSTGFEDIEDAHLFGFPYINVSAPRPFDTVLLNYNWQIWETQAFSLYAGTTDVIDHDMAKVALDGIRRFMTQKEFILSADPSTPRSGESQSNDAPQSYAVDKSEAPPVSLSTIVTDQQLLSIQSPHAGLLVMHVSPGQQVQKGQVLASIMHPYEGNLVCNVEAPSPGIIFFARTKSITYQNTMLLRMIVPL